MLRWRDIELHRIVLCLCALLQGWATVIFEPKMSTLWIFCQRERLHIPKQTGLFGRVHVVVVRLVSQVKRVASHQSHTLPANRLLNHRFCVLWRDVRAQDFIYLRYSSEPRPLIPSLFHHFVLKPAYPQTRDLSGEAGYRFFFFFSPFSRFSKNVIHFLKMYCTALAGTDGSRLLTVRERKQADTPRTRVAHPWTTVYFIGKDRAH